MKANAPEKIYILPHRDYSDKRIMNAFTEKEDSEDIEYIRKDAFVEKVCAYLDENCRRFILTEKDIDDFRNYMKGK